MIKKIIVFTCVFLLSFMSSVFAHTHLKSSTPENGEVVTEQLQQVTLTFETKIEQGSTMTLQNANDESITIDNISINNDQLIGELSSPLENGDYTLGWSIIGADGHPIDESISFTIDIPVENTGTQEQENGTVEETNVEEQEETVEETTTQTEENLAETENHTDHEVAEEPEEENSILMPFLIGALIGIVVVVLFFMIRRKK